MVKKKKSTKAKKGNFFQNVKGGVKGVSNSGNNKKK